jgi:TonB family protein
MLLALVTATACRAQEERRAIQKPAPVYPSLAKQLNLTGVVRIRALITPDGQVKQAEVVGGHPVLADAALDAVKKWKYEPTKTETMIELEFRFRP